MGVGTTQNVNYFFLPFQDPLPVGVSLNRIPFFFIECPSELINLGKVLKCLERFAFDLERTIPFRHGPTKKDCLLQISTQNEDFVIDTLAFDMRSHMLS